MYQSVNELAKELEITEHELLLFIKDNEIDIKTLSVISNEAVNYIQHVFNPSWVSQAYTYFVSFTIPWKMQYRFSSTIVTLSKPISPTGIHYIDREIKSKMSKDNENNEITILCLQLIDSDIEKETD